MIRWLRKWIVARSIPLALNHPLADDPTPLTPKEQRETGFEHWGGTYYVRREVYRRHQDGTFEHVASLRPDVW